MKKNKEKSLLSITHVVGRNLVAPLLFEDKETGSAILNDLRVEKDVMNATILTVKNEKFGDFSKEGNENFDFSKINGKSEMFKYIGDELFIDYAIKSENERIGTLRIRADVSEIKDQLYRRSQLTFLVILFGGGLSFLLVFVLQIYITKPINNLVQVMSDIMKQKNYSLRSKINSGDEIGKMSSVFNELLDDVEHYSKKLVETNNQLEQRVEARTQELKLKNEKLIIAKEKEEETNKLKEQFMASISHEIRTPLNAIIGFQELLQDTPLNEEQREFLHSIDFAGKNLMVLINDILDISKIDAGKFVFNEEEINFRETIHSVIELMEYRTKEKGIDLSFEIDDKIPDVVLGDQARLSQVLINLIGNAIKFTEEGFVKLSVLFLSETKKDVRCEFRIKDTGIGIPKEKLDMIFDRFTQVSSETTKKYGGTGLGLSIVKEIVERQGGKIGVESKVGEGSTFYFEFNFKKVKKSAIEKKSDEVVKDQVLPNIGDEKLKGLLAEDIVVNQKLLKKISEKWGYDLDVVSNGKEAFEQVQKNNYDFILMDIQMPVMDGLTAAKMIRGLDDPIKKTIPIIALSAHATDTEASKSLNTGMNAYMSKPFNVQKLKEKIQELVLHKVVKTTDNVDKKENDSSDYDLSHLIKHAAGDENFLKEIYQEFIIEMPDKMKSLHEMLKENDKEGIHKLFHSLYSIFPTFGMYNGLNLLKEIIENIDKDLDSKKLEQQISQLDALVNNTLENLEKEIKLLEKQDKV